MARSLLIHSGQKHIEGLSLLNQWKGDWRTVGVEFENIPYEIRDGILYLTLNHPEVRNALTPEVRGDIGVAAQCVWEDDQIRVVIVTGAGEKALASGAGIRGIHNRNYLKMLLDTVPATLKNLEDLCKPVTCTIDGYVLGDGCELAVVCDTRITTRCSRPKQSEVGLGIIPDAGGTQRSSRLVGPGKTKELIYTGKIITAEETRAIGLVNQVTEDDRGVLITAAEEIARQVTAEGSVAITTAEMTVNLGYKIGINTGLTIEHLVQIIVFGTEDRKEGTATFLEKRLAQFKEC